MVRSMKILVTGHSGFLGRNLIEALKTSGDEQHKIYTYDKSDPLNKLEEYARDCDFVYHLAAVHRPDNKDEFLKVNLELFSTLLMYLEEYHNKSPVLYTSSIQAVQDTEYAKSKRLAEEALKEHGRRNNSRTIIYRLTNTFGKWAKPFGHSVVATFCYQVARDQEITIHNPDTVMNFYYIDDVIASLLTHLEGDVPPQPDGYYHLEEKYQFTVTLKELAGILTGFRLQRQGLYLPDIGDRLVKRLYSTYLSYLPLEKLIVPLSAHTDNRGSFMEIFKTDTRGQISLNITKPGIKKGDHYHNTKCERFLVISGKAKIQLRRTDSEEITEYYVTGDDPRFLEIPPGITHNLINVGDTDLYTLIWANEVFDPLNTDTYFCPVIP
jgi:UDP-2-acetamido-2,6-beta-L-arabino-hexul-4-ose reductase